MNKFKRLLRWILVIPVMTIAGALVNLVIISVVALFGKKLVDFLYFPLEFGILPGVIGYFIVRYGLVLTPENNLKTLHKLFKVLVVFEIFTIFILAPNTEITKDFLPTHLQIIKSSFSILGGLLGMYFVKKTWIKEGKLFRNEKEKETWDEIHHKLAQSLNKANLEDTEVL